MSRIDLNRFRTGFISSLLAATVAICTLPLFIYREKTKAAVLSQNALVSESDTKAAGYSSEKAFRDAVLSSCQRLEGVKYEWGGGGWNGIDCAGSVSIAYADALGTVSIKSTPGSYGSRTLSYSGGGNPDKYGFYRPGFAGIKTSFTNGIYKIRGITPSENHFSSFETNGVTGIQSEEWLDIINTYGFKPGDMIVWWNDSNDSVNAQHITIYAGIEDGVPVHWTASSSAGYFCKKPLADSSSEAGKGSFTGFMGLKATALIDAAYVGFYIDKRDPSGINYTGCVFSVYKDSGLTNKTGELRDDDGNGIYSDYYALKDGEYVNQKYRLTLTDEQSCDYFDDLFFKETTAPSGVILPDGSYVSLKDPAGNVPSYYEFKDESVYEAKIRLNRTNGSTGRLEYSVTGPDGTVLLSASDSSYSYNPGSNDVVITNMVSDSSSMGRGTDGGLFTDASSIKLEKTTSTAFDVTSTEFTVFEGSDAVAVYKYSDGSWKWFDAFGREWPGAGSFPVKYGTEYTLTESFAKGEPYKCADGSILEYEYSNDSGWNKTGDTSYEYTFTTGDVSSKETYSYVVMNNRISGKFKLLKNVSDEDDSPEGFVFELWDESKTVLLAKGTSAADGTVYWENGSGQNLASLDLPSGKYVLAEIIPVKCFENTSAGYAYKIPEGFKDGKDGKWYKDIVIGSELYTDTVTNDRSESSIRITKSSEDGEIKDVGFELFYGGNSDEPLWQDSKIAEGKTNSKGVLKFANLPSGWYRIDEVVMPFYKVTWDDGSEGRSRTVRITGKDDNRTIQVRAENRIDINPVLSTELTGSLSSHDVNCGKYTRLTDRVFFENLVAGCTYTITGTLVNKKTGEVLKDREEREYKISIPFTADESVGEIYKDINGREVVKGYIDVGFLADTDHLFSQAFASGESSLEIVCFEELEFRGITIAEHCDLEDEHQTVRVAPEITTKAVDNGTGTGVLTLAETVGITDTVSYKGLEPGEAYVLTGTLIDKATGKLYMDADGRTYSETVTFVPEASSGDITVCFTEVMVPEDYVEIVVFETLRLEAGKGDIASHEDINDIDQTLRRPTCSTLATTSGGRKAFWEDTTVTVIDHVCYENLEPGKTYYARATLMLSDGTSVISKGNEVVSVQEFEPQEPSGSVDVTLKFDSKNLNRGDRVVVMENIYDKSTAEEIDMGLQTEDVHVLSHEDLNNMDQSLNVTSIPVLGDLGEGSVEKILGIALVITGAASIVVAFEIRRRRLKRGI